MSCLNNFDNDHVLDLGDNLCKNLGLKRYLDAQDLPDPRPTFIVVMDIPVTSIKDIYMMGKLYWC